MKAQEQQHDITKQAKTFTSNYQRAYNEAVHTTGVTAASFTSTAIAPSTQIDRVKISDEEFMLTGNKVQEKGYAKLKISGLGDLTLELQTKYAPRTVYNFIMLSKTGYYRGVEFHRNLKNFMIQGGDPTGTGRGGKSFCSDFKDEIGGPLRHDKRGIVSMANRGKNTNSSQFFITYKSAPHLDKKHTIFGIVIDGYRVLDALEQIEVDSNSRPNQKLEISDISIIVDPFDVYMKKYKESLLVKKKEYKMDDNETWTGKTVASSGNSKNNTEVQIGKYLSKNEAIKDKIDNNILQKQDNTQVEYYDRPKKRKSTGFGDFSAW